MNTFTIKVRTLSSVVINVEANPTTTISKIKDDLFVSHGFEKRLQRIIFKGHELRDSSTVHECGLNVGDTVFLVARDDNVDSEVTGDASEAQPLLNEPTVSEVTFAPPSSSTDPLNVERRDRWASRLELARSALKWASVRARPAASNVADMTRTGGTMVSRATWAGGLLAGSGLTAVGMAVGGSAGLGVLAVGGVVGVAGFAGAWVVDKVGRAAAMGIDLAGVITEKSLEASEWSVRGLASVASQRQAEFLLGAEGAAVLEHVVANHQELTEHVGDVTRMQLIRGLLALACLQRILAPSYAAIAFHRRRPTPAPPPAAAFFVDGQPTASPSRVEDPYAAVGVGERPGGAAQQPVLAGEAERVLRLARTEMMTYGAAHNALLGDGRAADVPGGDEAAVIKYLGLSGPEDLLATRWRAEGPHAPGFILVADPHLRAIVLAIRGTFGIMDTLTDLRCAAGPIRFRPPRNSVTAAGGQKEDMEEEEDGGGDLEMVHTGMWESAVRLDGEVRELVEDALAGRCRGYSVELTGHSLGAGVAGLLALRWRSGPFPNARCLALAPPCTVSARLAQKPWVRECVTAVIRADDAVCRWSLGSTKDACRAASELASKRGVVQRLMRIALLGLKDRAPFASTAAPAAPVEAAPMPSAPLVPDEEEWEGWVALSAAEAEEAASVPAEVAEELDGSGAAEGLLEGLPVEQLRRIAQDEGADLRGCLEKGDLIQSILAVQAHREPAAVAESADGTGEGRKTGNPSRRSAAAGASEQDESFEVFEKFMEDREWCEDLMQKADAAVVAEKLYPLGRCVWLVQVPPDPVGGGGQHPSWTALEASPENFERLVLSPSMVSDHVIQNYQSVLRTLLGPFVRPAAEDFVN